MATKVLDPFSRNGRSAVDDTTSTKPAPKYVVAQSEVGPYLDEHGKSQNAIELAKLHDSQAMAGIFADHAMNRGNYAGNSWRVLPAPDGANTDPDTDPDGPYDQARGDASYARLGRRAA